jgi:hypothetical protein
MLSDIIAMFTKKDDQIAECVLSMLLNMTSSPETKTTVLDQLSHNDSFIEDCIQLALVYDRSITSKVLNLLSRLCQHEKTITVKLLPQLQGIVHCVSQQFESTDKEYANLDENKKKLLDSLMRCITSCAAIDASVVSKEMLRSLIVPVLKLSGEGRLMAGNAALVVYYSASRGDPSMIKAMESYHVVDCLASMIKQTERDTVDAQVQKNAAIAIAALANHESCRSRMRELDVFKVMGQKASLFSRT